MDRYWTIFKISFAQEFAYKLNFVMWRVRNVLQVFIVFFLWDSVFADPGRVVFGYDREKIITYVFGALILRALIFSARSVDVPGEIAEGTLTNYLLKPVNYFKYWLTRDISSKALNLAFAVVEMTILFFLLKPEFFFQTNAVYLIGFIVSLVIANFLLFVIRFITSFITFWAPEMAWGSQFLVVVTFTDFLSGSIFPLDIFPAMAQKILYMTPFPYILFFPLQVYLGKVTPEFMLQGISISIAWCLIMVAVMSMVWGAGLKVYRAEGR